MQFCNIQNIRYSLHVYSEKLHYIYKLKGEFIDKITGIIYKYISTNSNTIQSGRHADSQLCNKFIVIEAFYIIVSLVASITIDLMMQNIYIYLA